MAVAVAYLGTIVAKLGFQEPQLPPSGGMSLLLRNLIYYVYVALTFPVPGSHCETAPWVWACNFPSVHSDDELSI